MADVKLYELEIGTLNVTVKGLSPLLTHRFSDDKRGDVESTQQGGAGPGWAGQGEGCRTRRRLG